MANNNSGNRNPDQKNRRIPILKKKRNKIPPRTIWITLLGILIFSAVALGVYTISAVITTPHWDPQLLSDQKQSSVVFDNEGNSIAQLHASENRLIVNYEDIPKLVKDTFINVEDKRFYEHFGADPIRIIKSAFNNLVAGEVVEGGSTITIQLARNAFIEDPTAIKLKRKIQELVLAIQIERTYTKDEILTFYLNRIFFGESSFGVRTASLTYFGKELKDLNPAEVALLAGLPKGPSIYDPYVYPENAKKRRNIVLGVMKDNGIISQTDYDKYKEEPFTFVNQVKSKQAKVKLPEISTRNKQHPYFVDYVIAELQDKYKLSPEQIYNGGLKIYATVNSKIQDAAEKAFANPDNFPKSVDNTPVQGAMTVLEPATGAITAMVGGREYTPMGLNRAWQSRRQPGSTAKPLVVYAPALEHGGFYPGTVFDDMPVQYSDGAGGVWAPVDYDTETSGWRGLITMREAVRDSVNVFAVKLLSAMGVDYGWQFAKNNLGLPLNESEKVLSLGLGTFQVSTLEMASAYGTFSNGGVKTEPYSVIKVVGPDGKTIVENTPSKKRVMKETTAYLMNDLLRTVVTSGTGTKARIGDWYICGKTGTTSLDPNKYGYKSGNPDAWFAGYSPKYTGIVWMGYDSDPDKKHYLYKVYGGSYPAGIWKQVMTVAHEGLPVQTYINRPEGLTSVRFDTKSGLLPSSLTPSQFISEEISAVDSVPTSVSNAWVEVKVDPNKPDIVAPDDSYNTITKLCLNVTDRPNDVVWPNDEAPYKMPKKSSDLSSTPSGETPPAGNTNLPRLSIGSPAFDRRTSKVQIPITSNYDSKKYTAMLYIKRPGLPYLETFKPEDTGTKSIYYNLNLSGNGSAPGTYTFWAALMENDSFTVGPPSNSVSLQVTD
ncbi:MAG: PBP1A family penicillin-binding protein [Peptococcaceae bacterium]|nr:PBP1A family penicillin-binding protein [Peptococcaceae bacterium]